MTCVQDIDDYFQKVRDAANSHAAGIQQSSNVSHASIMLLALVLAPAIVSHASVMLIASVLALAIVSHASVMLIASVLAVAIVQSSAVQSLPQICL